MKLKLEKELLNVFTSGILLDFVRLRMISPREEYPADFTTSRFGGSS